MKAGGSDGSGDRELRRARLAEQVRFPGFGKSTESFDGLGGEEVDVDLCVELFEHVPRRVFGAARDDRMMSHYVPIAVQALRSPGSFERNAFTIGPNEKGSLRHDWVSDAQVNRLWVKTTAPLLCEHVRKP